MNELSSALKRRFNTVVLPVPDNMEEEVEIVAAARRAARPLARAAGREPAIDEIRRVVTIFRELREGKTADGKSKLKQPSSTLSTAEAISVITSGIALATHFGRRQAAGGRRGQRHARRDRQGPGAGPVVMQEYLETVIKERDGWKDLYRACKDVL